MVGDVLKDLIISNWIARLLCSLRRASLFLTIQRKDGSRS